MSYPWSPSLVASILRGMPDERLAVITYQAFQMSPCADFLPSAIGTRLIAEERARRAHARRYAPPGSRDEAGNAPVQRGLFD